MEYKRASQDFEKFLIDARDFSGLATTHQAYTMVQGVLQVFRRRLGTREAIAFAGALPPASRALFVADWDTSEPRRPFAGEDVMAREAQALRAEHNSAPDSTIRDVAAALRGNIDAAKLDRLLSTLPEGAARFWRVD
jgi:uncharacterized protein (DUF2267 family)